MTVELVNAGGERQQLSEWPLMEIVPESPNAPAIHLIAGTWMSETSHVFGAVRSVMAEETERGVPVGVTFEMFTGERAILGFPEPPPTPSSPGSVRTRAGKRQTAARRSTATRTRGRGGRRGGTSRKGRAKAGKSARKRSVVGKRSVAKKRTRPGKRRVHAKRGRRR